MERVHVWVTGRVQGVWFRASTHARALELGLDGWVRNLPDGRVEAVAQGAPDAVQAWVKWVHRGPPHARVDQVVVESEPPVELTGFEVR
jgi:acylphosphatase